MEFLSSTFKSPENGKSFNIFNWDYLQIISLVFLSGVGLIFINSIGDQIGSEAAALFFEKQLQWLCAGVILWLIGSFVNVKSNLFFIFSILFYIITVVLLVAVLFIGKGGCDGGCQRCKNDESRNDKHILK